MAETRRGAPVAPVIFIDRAGEAGNRVADPSQTAYFDELSYFAFHNVQILLFAHGNSCAQNCGKLSKIK